MQRKTTKNLDTMKNTIMILLVTISIISFAQSDDWKMKRYVESVFSHSNAPSFIKKMNVNISLYENTNMGKQEFLDSCLQFVINIFYDYDIQIRFYSLQDSLEKNGSIRYRPDINLYLYKSPYVLYHKKYLTYGNEILLSNTSIKNLKYYLLHTVGEFLGLESDTLGFMSDSYSLEIGPKTDKALYEITHLVMISVGESSVKKDYFK